MRTDDRTVAGSGGEMGDPWEALLTAAANEAGRRMGKSMADSGDMFGRGAVLLDTYRIESEPIHGGMGSVWRVRHMGWDTDLAMKRPQPHMFADHDSKETFIRECQSWIDLGLHPNIVACYYVREIQDVPAIFSEWMDNGSLENSIQNERLYDGTADEVKARLLDIAIQFARGLHYAHGKGLIHQDVKPDNLLLTGDWEAKVADFGLARARGVLTVQEENGENGATRMTPSGGYTPAYCSMEQMDGKMLTRRTDIYSWAVSVLEMYHGSRPWANGVVAGFGCRGYFPDCRVPVPETLQELLAQCLEMDPDARPHGFDSIEERLKEIYSQETGRDYPRLFSSVAADTADTLNNRALTYLDLGFPGKAEEAWKQALEIDPDHPASVYNQGLWEWRAGRIDDSELIRRCSSSLTQRGQTEGNRLLAWIENERGDEEDTNPENRVIRGHSYFQKLAVSADGKSLYTGEEGLACYDIRTMDRRYTRNLPKASALFRAVNAFALSPDGKILLHAGWENVLHVVDTDTGRDRRSVRIRYPVGVCVHPDGQHCFLWQDKALMKRWNYLRGVSDITYSSTMQSIVCAAVSADGRLLCAASGHREMALWNVSSGRLLHMIEDTGVEINGLCFSPDSTRVYSSSKNGLTVWNTGDWTHEDVITRDGLNCICMSRDGRYLLTGDMGGALKLWETENHRCLRTFAASRSPIQDIAAAPDFSAVFTSARNGEIRLHTVLLSTRRAPWELCRVRGYEEEINAQREAEKQAEKIGQAMERFDYGRALELLEDAESRMEPYRFLPQRRCLARRCIPGELTGVYEYSSLPSPESLDTSCAVFHPNNETLAVSYATVDPKVEGSRIDILGAGMESVASLPAAFGGPQELSYSCTGRLLSGGLRQYAQVWDTDSGETLGTVRTVSELKNFGMMTVAAMDPGERLLMTAAWEGTLALWRLPDMKMIWWTDTEYSYYDVCFVGGRHVALADSRGGLALFDIAAKRQTAYERLYDRMISGLTLTPDKKQLYISFFDEIGIYDTEKWEKTGAFRPYPKNLCGGALAFSRDQELMATTGPQHQIDLWHLPDKKHLYTLQVPERTIKSLSFSADGCILCAACGISLRFWVLNRKFALPGDEIPF